MNDGTLLLLSLCGIAWFWHASRKAHEKALEISKVVCTDLKVQRLDEGVALRQFKLHWSRHGLELVRVYSFEFSSDGVNRCRGEISLIGLSLTWVRIEHPDGDYFIDVAPKHNA